VKRRPPLLFPTGMERILHTSFPSPGFDLPPFRKHKRFLTQRLPLLSDLAFFLLSPLGYPILPMLAKWAPDIPFSPPRVVGLHFVWMAAVTPPVNGRRGLAFKRKEGGSSDGPPLLAFPLSPNWAPFLLSDLFSLPYPYKAINSSQSVSLPNIHNGANPPAGRPSRHSVSKFLTHLSSPFPGENVALRDFS